MDGRSPRNADGLAPEARARKTQAGPEIIPVAEPDDQDLDDSPDIDDPGDGFEADLNYLFEKNDELFRRLSLND